MQNLNYFSNWIKCIKTLFRVTEDNMDTDTASLMLEHLSSSVWTLSSWLALLQTHFLCLSSQLFLSLSAGAHRTVYIFLFPEKTRLFSEGEAILRSSAFLALNRSLAPRWSLSKLTRHVFPHCRGKTLTEKIRKRWQLQLPLTAAAARYVHNKEIKATNFIIW